jgi:hypothetical protein
MAKYYKGLKDYIQYKLIQIDLPLTLQALAKQAICINDWLYFWNRSKKGGYVPYQNQQKETNKGNLIILGVN